MASSYTSLLGLVLPVQGELQGQWGNTVNNELTSLLDTAIAGTTTISTDADVTLTDTDGSANQARQAIILWTANGSTTRNITAPAQSKSYVVINKSAGTQSIVVRGAGPTTGVMILKGEQAVVAWDGADFVKVSTFGGSPSFTDVTVTGTTTLSGLTASTALALNASKEVVSVTNTGTGNNVLATSPTLTTPNLGTPSAVTLTNATGLPVSTGISGFGTGVATALAVNTGSAGAFVVNGGALGTPSSGTVTNLTGTASININGTVGATTPSTGAFTTLSTSGNVTLGDASTDTVTVNGTMGVGGAGNARAGIWLTSSALTGGAQEGIVALPVGTSAATATIRAIVGRADTAAASFTVGNVSQLYADNSTKGAGSTITNQHGLYVADQTQGTNNYGITSLVSSGTNKWNIYASGTANNAFAGNVRIGSTTAPTNALDVTGAMTVSGNVTLGDATTDTVTVNGYMGVGGAASSGIGVRVLSNALASVAQYGIVSDITSTSAATTRTVGVYARVNTAAATYTVANAADFIAGGAGAVIGAGSSITNAHGLYIEDHSAGTNNYGITSLVSSGTNKWNIYASGTAENYFAGNVGIGTSPVSYVSGVPSIRVGLYGSVNGFQAPITTSNIIAINSGAYTVSGTQQNYFVSGQAVTSYSQYLGQHRFYTAPSGTVDTAITFSERANIGLTEMVINDPGNDYDFRVESDTNTHALFVQGSDGNVGIGTSSPGARLEVQDTANDIQIRIGAATGSAGVNPTIRFQARNTANSASRYASIKLNVDDTLFTLMAPAGSTPTIDALNIDSSGNVGIGTSAPAAPTTSATTLHVHTPTAGKPSAIYLTNADTGSTANDGTTLLTAATSGDFDILQRESASVKIYTAATERLRITSDGYLRMASGTGGIQFNGDTAAANALDDYEQGTFTPTIVGATTAGTASYSAQVGRYTKIGRLVTVQFTITWTGGTGTGDLRVGSLPFTSNNTANNYASGCGQLSNVALSANNYGIFAIVPNVTYMTISQAVVGGGAATNVQYDAAGTIIAMATYEV
jgi:hypothetical protein